jgi:hypothetical protein
MNWSEIGSKTLELFKHLVSVFIETVFLVLWTVLQITFKSLLNWCQSGLEGVDSIVFQILQVVFAISTIAPILISLYREISIMAKRARAEIGRA